ncbi:SLC35F5 [Acanthosepion pharaonis]|uniref:Solute carrier family 35 member F5 n=1 Tax=Acanthosepion pharaonis TaxID=158019 RepID=A0A812BQX8_ACAPH|nr:SLC35F5 [Sepia pharaonis]
MLLKYQLPSPPAFEKMSSTDFSAERELYFSLQRKNWISQIDVVISISLSAPGRESAQRFDSIEDCPIDTDKLLGDPIFVPIKFDDKSSGAESDESSNDSKNKSTVRFSNLSEVRQLSDIYAEEAVIARLSYNASVRAEEARLRALSKLSLKQVAKIAFIFCILWFFGNFCYQKALDDTEASIVNVLSSTSSLFTLVGAAVYPSNSADRFTLSKLAAVMFSICGITLVSLTDSKFEKGIPAGSLWALGGSLLYAAYLVVLKRKADHEDKLDLPMFFGFVGFFNTLFLWPGFFLLHYSKQEIFEWPTDHQWMFIAINGMIGTVLSEMLWLWGCFLTSSLIGTLALSLTIPLSMLADVIIKGVRSSFLKFNWQILIFLFFSFSSFSFSSFFFFFFFLFLLFLLVSFSSCFFFFLFLFLLFSFSSFFFFFFFLFLLFSSCFFFFFFLFLLFLLVSFSSFFFFFLLVSFSSFFFLFLFLLFSSFLFLLFSLFLFLFSSFLFLLFSFLFLLFSSFLFLLLFSSFLFLLLFSSFLFLLLFFVSFSSSFFFVSFSSSFFFVSFSSSFFFVSFFFFLLLFFFLRFFFFFFFSFLFFFFFFFFFLFFFFFFFLLFFVFSSSFFFVSFSSSFFLRFFFFFVSFSSSFFFVSFSSSFSSFLFLRFFFLFLLFLLA